MHGWNITNHIYSQYFHLYATFTSKLDLLLSYFNLTAIVTSYFAVKDKIVGLHIKLLLSCSVCLQRWNLSKSMKSVGVLEYISLYFYSSILIYMLLLSTAVIHNQLSLFTSPLCLQYLTEWSRITCNTIYFYYLSNQNAHIQHIVVKFVISNC